MRRRRAREEEIEYYTGREGNSPAAPQEEELGGGAGEDAGARHLEGENGTCEVWRVKFYSLERNG